MLNELFTNKVVTFKEKQIIEHAQGKNMEGMKWFLDNVIIASLELGVITKYNGFIEVMEEHDDPLFREMAGRLSK